MPGLAIPPRKSALAGSQRGWNEPAQRSRALYLLTSLCPCEVMSCFSMGGGSSGSAVSRPARSLPCDDPTASVGQGVTAYREGAERRARSATCDTWRFAHASLTDHQHQLRLALAGPSRVAVALEAFARPMNSPTEGTWSCSRGRGRSPAHRRARSELRGDWSSSMARYQSRTRLARAARRRRWRPSRRILAPLVR